jgi:hypothetical protein
VTPGTYVDVEHGGNWYRCQMAPDPMRWKCGRCRRGNVCWSLGGAIGPMQDCRVCGGKARITIISPPIKFDPLFYRPTVERYVVKQP